jgi:serine protease AprX
MDMKNRVFVLGVTVAILAFAACSVNNAPTTAAAVQHQNQTMDRESMIVQAADMETAAAAVRAVGGEITHELAIIRAVGALLTPSQAAVLAKTEGITISANRGVEASTTDTNEMGFNTTQVFFPQIVGADLLHDQGITGYGVTIAILDTGVWNTEHPLTWNSLSGDRIVGAYDSIKNMEGIREVSDESGHGTHITSVTVNSETDTSWNFNGVAPDADLVVVRSFDEGGRGTYLDVIRGIEWVVEHKDRFNVRVLNCSFSAEPQSHYWDDPINQALMVAWKAGIVVVASAGNSGPDAMTVGVPGNCPYVITVGAMTDNYTPEVLDDDFLASFSAAGPTVEGFVKPDIVAPGGHIVGMMARQSEISSAYPDFQVANKYFVMSGTSQAAAVTTGATALLLQAAPWLEPDEVKCRLMTTAQVAVDEKGHPAYSVFQQGAGLLAVDAAVANDCGPLDECPTNCANAGLDVAVDLDPVLEIHYGGPARMDEDGNFFIENDEEGLFFWDGDYAWSEGFLWNNAFLWNSAFLWNNGVLWNSTFLWNNAFLWSDAFLWNDAFLWFNAYSSFDDYTWSGKLTETVGTDLWVEHE